MPARKHNVEEIVATLRQMERLTEGGMSVAAAARSLGITDQTYYRWRTRYGSLPEGEAKRLQVLDEENARLKRVLAEQAQDVSMLQDLTQGEIVSAARRREAVDYLVQRYQISERRACRLVGQHRSTQRYGAPGRDEGGPGEDAPDVWRDLGQGGVAAGEWHWHGGEDHPANGTPSGAGSGAGNGAGNGNGNGWGPGEFGHEDARPLAPVRKLPFVDDRVPCFNRLRSSLLHDLVWLTRESEMARFVATNPVLRRIEQLAATPHGLVQRVRGGAHGAPG